MQINLKNLVLGITLIIENKHGKFKIESFLNDSSEPFACLTGYVANVDGEDWVVATSGDKLLSGDMVDGKAATAWAISSLADALSKFDIAGVRDAGVITRFASQPNGDVIVTLNGKDSVVVRMDGTLGGATTIIDAITGNDEVAEKKKTRTDLIARVVKAQAKEIVAPSIGTDPTRGQKLRDLERLMRRCEDGEFDIEFFTTLLDQIGA